MEKILIVLIIAAVISGINTEMKAAADNTQPVVTIEIPASNVESIDVKYENTNPSSAPKAMDATKNATKKTVDATKDVTDKTVKATKNATKKTVNTTKDVTDKTVKATKNATKKTVNATKDVTDKTVKATKNATKKTVQSTKDFTDKTVDSAKDVIDNMNPNKPVTLERLETESSLKTLKNERNEKKSAYNSKIKDINAKIKAAEKSTTISDTQRQNKIYTLNKEKSALIEQRNNEVNKYNNKINKIKQDNKKEEN